MYSKPLKQEEEPGVVSMVILHIAKKDKFNDKSY